MLNRLKNNTNTKKFIYFFPIQLLLVHFKKNHTILLFWLILLGFITQNIALKYGIPYLFLDPEYLGTVNYISFIIVGFACGGFIMSYNIASYIRNSFRFPFLATLSNPFLKYCINNSILPLTFLTTYIYQIIKFQNLNEYTSALKIAGDIAGLLFGIALFTSIALLYFSKTNKDIFQLFGIGVDDSAKDKTTHVNTHQTKTERVYLKNRSQWKSLNQKEERDWHVETYLSGATKIRIARGYEHYDKQLLKAVYNQNHKNATLFQIAVIISLVGLGLLRDYTIFSIPAGASLILLATMLLMITSALYSYLRGWTTAFFLLLLVSINYLSERATFHNVNKIVGLDYSKTSASYSNKVLKDFNEDTAQVKRDINQTLGMLQNWKSKICGAEYTYDNFQKPKLIFINTSGGGLRSAVWSTHVLDYIDSLTQRKLFNHTVLITGSSGGAVGAAYWRELQYDRVRENKHYNHDAIVNNIAQDVLNPITLTIATNDIFLRLKKIKLNGNTYVKDRGIALEEKLNENCNGIFNRKLKEYRIAEKNASIPMLILSPTIINDGRRLLISSQAISYLTNKNLSNSVSSNNYLTESVEFARLFKAQQADNLKMISALRMNASFPYISPIVSLPSNPTMEIMDAGIRDNYGLFTTIQFLHVFKDWIAENTSGVVIVQIRDRKKDFGIEDHHLPSVTETFMSPIGSFYDNLFHIQDYNFDQLTKYTNSWFAGKIDMVTLQLKNNTKENISLSWHLTTRERNQIKNSIYESENVTNVKKLQRLLNE